jgi:two-component system response regulator YesN
MHYSDLSVQTERPQYPFEEERNLCDGISKGRQEDVSAALENLMAWVVASCRTIEDIHLKLFEIIVMETRTAAGFEHIDSKLLDTASYWEDIRSIQTVKEIQEYMQKTASEIVQGINNVRNMNLNEQISQAIDFIKNNYEKDINLEDVAKVVSLSPYYFSKLFKNVTGENFIDYLTRFRMSLAASLLKEGYSNIKGICYRVGYNDPNYFSKLFKRYYQMNPSEYKDSLKK